MFTNRLIAVPVVSKKQATTTEWWDQFFDSVDAVAAPAVLHDDQPSTASQLSSGATGGQPEISAAETTSARSVVPLLGSKPTKSSKFKRRIKFKPNKLRGKVPSKSH